MPLTPQQLAARDHVQGSDRNAAVQSRAGTGKSFVIKEMVKTISRRDRTLVVAFNKDNADATRAALPRWVDVKTLHALGYAAIQQARNTKLAPDGRRVRGLADAIVPFSPAYDRRVAAAMVARLASIAMCHLAVTPEAITPLMPEYGLLPDPAIPRTTYGTWAATLLAECRKPASTISFDEMVFLPAIEGIFTGNYDFVFFDEAQDGNAAQKRLVRAALAESGKATIVYDDRQCIYRFRGASEAEILGFVDELDADVLPLTVTFRCPQRVVRLARCLVEDYEACEAAPEGRVTWESEDDLLAKIAPGHVVLGRSNFSLSRMCLKLAKRGIRARIVGRDYAERFQSLLDLAPGDSVTDLLGWLSVYQREEGERLAASGDEARAEELAEVIETVRELSEGLKAKAEVTRRLNELFVDDDAKGVAVKLMTVHKSKGFQWTDVWMLETSFRVNTIEGENLYYIAATRTLWTPEHPGHLRLVQTPRKDGSWPESIARTLLPHDEIERWEADAT